MDYRKRIIPGGRAVSQAQYRFYQKLLDECDPEDTLRRSALTKALDVDYDTLPERKGSVAPAAPQPQPQAPRPRIEAIKIGNRTACYLVRTSPAVFFLSKADVWAKLHAAMPQVTRGQCLTLQEARSFLELDGVKVKSLKEAAEWWASDAPSEPTVPVPTAAPKAGWVDDDEDEFSHN